MRRKTVVLPRDAVLRLRALSRETGKPVSELMRDEQVLRKVMREGIEEIKRQYDCQVFVHQEFVDKMKKAMKKA